MNKLEKVFTDFINQGGAAANRITEPDKKAMAYAALAQAIAHSGLLIEGTPISQVTAEVIEEVKEEAPATGKDSLKESASKGKTKTTAKKTTKKEEVEEAPIEEAPEHPAVDTTHVEENAEASVEEEWTDEMQTLKAEQLNLLNQYIDAWTEDFVCRECLGNFFEDSSITADQLWDYIRPTNIDGFIAYLVSLSE